MKKFVDPSRVVKRKKAVTARRAESKFTVWFKDGSSVEMFASYPNDIYDQLPPKISMNIERIVDYVE